MRRPADFQRSDAATQRAQSSEFRKLCGSAARRLILIAAVTLALATPLAARVPGSPSLPALPSPVTTGPTTGEPSLKRLLFGLGVGFESFAGAQGMAITRVLPDSPASRAGLAVGCVVTEINGIVTVGRTGEDCTRIIQSTFGPVRVKFLGADQQEKTLKLRKAWLPMPELRGFSP